MTDRLGIALSGGGARGVAHAGFLAALAEEGIRPDCIAGSSAGALVGALYASGLDAEAILEFFRTRSPFRMSKLAVRKPGWIDTDKITADLLEILPHHTFEMLPRKLYVATTDIVNGELAIFDSGELIPAVLASCSIPVIFTPVQIAGRLYADGGITNNFPVEPLLGRCRKILGFYASPIRQVRHDELGSSFSIWQRSLEVGMYSAARSKFGNCDLVLCPDRLTAYGLLDTKQIDEIFRVGYDATRERMDEIVALLGVDGDG